MSIQIMMLGDFELLDQSRIYDIKIPSPIVNRAFKVIGSGVLSAQGADRSLYISLNNDEAVKNYVSYVDMGGEDRAGEWGHERKAGGFYIGRNGRSHDAVFSFEFTFSALKGIQKVVGSGLSSFALGNSTIGFESHGFFTTANPEISSIRIQFSGGVANWNCRAYVM